MVTINIGHVTSRIEQGVLPFEVTNRLSEECSYEVKGAEFMTIGGKPQWQRKKKWDGKKRLYHKSFRTFPTGLLPRVITILEECGVEYCLDLPFKRTHKQYDLDGDFSLFEEREYQYNAIKAILFNRRCMVKVATGGGKTFIAARVINEIRNNTLFLVHTKDLMYQAIGVFQSIFGHENVGQIGDGVCRTRPITVCTLQTAAKILEVEFKKYEYEEDSDQTDKRGIDDSARVYARQFFNDVNVVIMDECHRVAAPTASNVLSGIDNAEYRIGLSASPWRDDGADFALEAIFGKVAVDIDASTLIRDGWLVKPFIRFVDVPRRVYPKAMKYSTVYDEYVVRNNDRNALGIKWALSLVRRNRPTLVLVRRIDHGKLIAEALQSQLNMAVPFLSGSDASEVRNSVLSEVRSGACRVLVATTIADEGLDLKPLSGIVLLGGGKSSTRALQRVGRVLRPYPGKDSAEIIDFVDNAKYLRSHTDKRNEIYASEDEFVTFGL